MSTTSTLTPPRPISIAAESPDRPAPTTIASAAGGSCADDGSPHAARVVARKSVRTRRDVITESTTTARRARRQMRRERRVRRGSLLPSYPATQLPATQLLSYLATQLPDLERQPEAELYRARCERDVGAGVRLAVA